MKLNIIKITFVAFMVAIICSCSSYKKVPYFQNSEEISLAASRMLYDAKIMPKDQLTITVSTTDPEVGVPFNLTVATPYGTAGRNTLTQQPTLIDYLVDNNGCINFPLLGTIKVAGMTKNELQDYVAKKIQPYMNNDVKPIVTVKLSNYRVAVMGEVARPGVFSVGSEKMSILEALALAGDLTIYGRRDNVKLLREDATGEKKFYHIDLNDASTINQPYYYVQQNDVIIVEPNKAKSQNSEIGQMTSIFLSSTSILLSLASLMYNIFK